MKKIIFIFSVLALTTSCKFNENGNKMVIPEESNSHHMEHHDSNEMLHNNQNHMNNERMTNAIMMDENHSMESNDSIHPMNNTIKEDTVKADVDSAL